MDIAWHQPEKNLAKIETVLSSIKNQFDIFVLPEMFTTGFTNQTELFKDKFHETLNKLYECSQKYNALFLGSIIVNEENTFKNRLYAINPKGQIHYYDKRHLFRIANEHKYYTPGNKQVIIQFKDWKIMLLICFDLRFPVWSRNLITSSKGYDIAVYVANWPKIRVEHWSTLLKARAIENQCYVIGANRVGIDENGIEYNGCSAIYDFEGKILAFNEGQECILYANISKEKLEQYRQNFPAYLSADSFEIN